MNKKLRPNDWILDKDVLIVLVKILLEDVRWGAEIGLKL